MDLTFHIIFCPRMVRYLRLAVRSVLRVCNYRFRLVANGLDAAEMHLLHEFCQGDERLECVPFPTRTMLPHGVMLSLLQQRETGAFFAFMDPDIFATHPFADPLERELAHCDVFSSCDPVRFDNANSQGTVVGHSRMGPGGLPLATTYFAVYRQEALRHVINETGTAFEAYPEPRFLSQHQQRQLARLGHPELARFDTGKLLNLLSHLHSLRFRHAELPELTHIGAITAALCRPGWLKERWARALHRPYILCDGDLDPAASRWRGWLHTVRERLRGRRLDLNRLLQQRRLRLERRRISAFFAFFLRSLVDGTPEPQLAITNPALRTRMESLCDAIRRAA